MNDFTQERCYIKKSNNNASLHNMLYSNYISKTARNGSFLMDQLYKN